MGEIVAAMATCHAPQLFTYPPDEDHAQLDATIASMRELGAIFDETKPDVLIFLGSDHLETFSIGCVPTFAILAGNHAIAEFAGRRFEVPVHREMAEEFLTRLIRADFDLAYSEDAILGHTFAVPFEFVLGGRDIPVIPFHTNVYMPPLPSPRRCAALGRAIAQIVAARPERVAILASGGMSHYPGTWKYPQPEFDFDRWVIGELERGNADAVLDLTVEQLDEVGNTELLTWAILFGAIGNRRGELLQYTPTWHHGHAMMRFIPARPPAGSSYAAAGDIYGGYKFKNQGFEFYKHPPASAYKLNKLLFEVRTNSDLQLRMLTDLDGVAAEWGLNAEEMGGARAIASVGRTVKISDNAEVLVKAGAHPLQALMCLHAVHGEFKKREREISEKNKRIVEEK
jgi:2,3-dihydroxyphenylpropionate 1,2-dioxygenase